MSAYTTGEELLLQILAKLQMIQTLQIPGGISTDTISELTADAGVTVDGALVKDNTVTASQIITDSITEKTAGSGVRILKAITRGYTTFAVNATASVAAADFNKGYFTSTSAAAVTLTLPTATALATQIGAVQGTIFDFFVDNSAGANTVTVAVNTGITVLSSVVITGTDTLTVSTGNGVGAFRLIFTSATTANIIRMS